MVNGFKIINEFDIKKWIFSILCENFYLKLEI